MLRCIKCGAELHNHMDGQGHQPSGGLSFTTWGHYGSTFFDPMDGSALQVAICDGCVEAAMADGAVTLHPAP